MAEDLNTLKNRIDFMISDINAIIYEYNKFEEIISDFLKNQKKFFLNLLDNVKIFKDWLKKKKEI